MNLNYKDTPFPYFYGSLDKEMYQYAHKLWSTDEESKSYNLSKKINTPEQLASAIIFKKNIRSGTKIKNIGEKILKKTIKELDKHIFNEFKKT